MSELHCCEAAFLGRAGKLREAHSEVCLVIRATAEIPSAANRKRAETYHAAPHTSAVRFFLLSRSSNWNFTVFQDPSVGLIKKNQIAEPKGQTFSVLLA